MARRSKPRRYPLVEWISAAVGLVIIAAMLGFLALESVGQRDKTPPLLKAEPTALVAGRDHFLVEVEVSNAARNTAASVGIEGTLKQGGSDIETSSASVAYVPGESRRRAGLIFTRDPRDYRLVLRVTGYERP
ncbi:MAG: hypothetical protein ACR2JJ_03085 [Sphingomicrobium sp.]